MSDKLLLLKSRLGAQKVDRDRKKAEFDASDAEVAGLETALRIIEAVPDCREQDLETALRVLHSLKEQHTGNLSDPSVQLPPRPASISRDHTHDGKSLAGKTILEATEIILRENGGAMFYKDIAAKAIRQGYRSGRENKGEESVVTSFAQTLRRYSGPGLTIAKAGEGYYSLTEQPGTEAANSNGVAAKEANGTSL